MAGAGFDRDERHAVRERARAIKNAQMEKKIAEKQWITRADGSEIERLQQEVRELRSIVRILQEVTAK